MSKDTHAPRQVSCAIPADVSAAITQLFDSLGQIAELCDDPKISGLAADASRAADVVLDGLEELASQLTVLEIEQ